VLDVENPSKLPPPQDIARIEEPFISASIMAPTEFVGPVLSLCQEKRGVHKGIEYLQDARVVIAYELPLNEIVLDFYDRLKSVSRGYASFDYDFLEYRRAPSSSWTSSSTARRWTRCPSSSTKTTPKRAVVCWRSACAS